MFDEMFPSLLALPCSFTTSIHNTFLLYRPHTLTIPLQYYFLPCFLSFQHITFHFNYFLLHFMTFSFLPKVSASSSNCLAIFHWSVLKSYYGRDARGSARAQVYRDAALLLDINGASKKARCTTFRGQLRYWWQSPMPKAQVSLFGAIRTRPRGGLSFAGIQRA